jgi:hypothetical protein
MPKRIQRRRTKGWRMPEGAAVYVGRPSRWGNFVRPGEIGADGKPYTRQQAVDLYRRATRFWTEDQLPLAPLRGHDLVCWCPLTYPDGSPYPCHADVLLELANG